MSKARQIAEIEAALKNWRHWVGNDMLDHLEVADVQDKSHRETRFRARLEGASDSAFSTIQEFFEIGPFSPKEDPIWGSGLKLFVSHVAASKNDLIKLTDALKPLGISPFLAHEAIKPMNKWHDVLLEALAGMDALLSFHAEGFRASEWCGQEVGFALGREVPVIPIMAGELPYGFVGQFQAIKWTEATNARAVDAVFASLVANPAIATVISEALARKLKFAGTWDAAGTCVERLQRCGGLNETALRNVQLALLLNDQVRGNVNAEGLMAKPRAA
jgi:hypothetical protein